MERDMEIQRSDMGPKSTLIHKTEAGVPKVECPEGRQEWIANLYLPPDLLLPSLANAVPHSNEREDKLVLKGEKTLRRIASVITLRYLTGNIQAASPSSCTVERSI
jgi:hypothetical protein